MLIEHVKDILKKEEGYCRYVYKDSLGHWTIGYGLCVEEGFGEGLSETDADYLLGTCVRRRVDELSRMLACWTRLPSAAQTVLVCMSYQLGVPKLLRFKNTLEAFSRNEWHRAADEMLDSLWAKQTPERAMRMAAIIRGLVSDPNEEW